ncbi:MAG: response regulator, partial [Chitinispirillaceae bacterium]|nr:response regulator [Chitinispirillaceae bacterium]
MDSPRKQSDVAEANILVADDESDVRELICEILADEKYHIASFDPHSSPEDLLHARYDVVILDIFMPKYDGFALHEEVKKHSPHAQFILITAHPEPDLVDRATRLGIYGFLTKPFTAEQIKYTVMGALRMRKLLHNRRKSTDAEATRRVDLVGALQRIDAIINSMGEGLLAVDNDNAIVLMNGVAEKITG